MEENRNGILGLFDRIARRWRERVDEIIENEELSRFGIDYQEYEPEKLKQRLLREYKGKRLEEVIPGQEVKTKEGKCYLIKSQDRISLKIINPKRAKKKILSDLKIIPGIREVTEQNLKKKGYKTIEDLTKHPSFGSEVKRLLELIDKRDTYQILDWIRHRFPRSHPLALYPSGLHNREDFIFVDIESMGLGGGVLIILFGLAQISDGYILINQYLVRNPKEEKAALESFLSRINEDSVFITFNGRAYDMHHIEERLAYYRMREDLKKPHFDMLHFSRRAWGERVPNFRLETLEKYLGIEREDHIPSYLIPDFYDTYMRSKNVGPLIPIIEHNKQDLVTIANIFSKLHEEWLI